MATKAEIIEKLSQCGGLSYKDWINLLDSIYFDGEIADVYQPISGNTLTTPSNQYTMFSILTEGTYTRSGQSPIVVPFGHIAVITWDGSIWSVTKQSKITSETLINETDIDSAITSGIYDVRVSDTAKYQMQVVASSTGRVRQMRITHNVNDTTLKPNLSYRYFDPSSSTWHGWFDASSVKQAKIADIDNILTSGLYELITSNNSIFLEVSVYGNYVTQYRHNPNVGGTNIDSDPYLMYRRINLGDASPTWSTWVDTRGVVNYPAGQIDSLTSHGLYKGLTESGSFFLQVQSLAGVVRQFRTFPNISGTPPYNQYLPIFRYRDKVGSDAWGSWTDLTFLPLANGGYNEVTKAGVYYRNQNLELPMLLIVNTKASSNIITQLRLYPNDTSSTVFQERKSTDNGVTWSNWTDILPSPTRLFDASSNSLESFTSGGLFKYTPSANSNNTWVQVAVSGDTIRQMRILSGVGSVNKPTLVFRDKVGSEPWTGWADAYNMIGFTGTITPIQADTLTDSGIWYVSSLNPYFIQVVNSGGVTRQFRTEPNISGEPRIIYRDYNTSTSSYGTWKVPAKQNNAIEPINEGVMWSWWTGPIATITRGSQDIIHVTYTDDRGNTGIISHPLGSQQYAKYPIKEAILDIDDHNAGGVITLSDGKMLTVFSSGHNKDRKFYGYKSKGKESFADREKVLDITLAGTTTYSEMLYINNVIYVFIRLRLSGTAWSWVMIKSNDNGVTWDDAKTILYSATYQWYGLFQKVEGNNNLIKFVHYSNPTLPASDLRGGYIDLVNDTVLDTDGVTVIGNVGDNNAVEDFEILIPSESGYFNRLLDLKVSPFDDWNILYCKFTTANDGIYRHYNNGVDLQITTAGTAFFASSRYYGGAIFGDNDIVYLSKNNGYNNTYWIQSWKNEAGTYVKEEDIHTSTKRAIRPAYHEGVLMWVEGFYNVSDYKDFQTRLNYKVIE